MADVVIPTLEPERRTIMIAKSLIAAAALATSVALIPATEAQAKTNIDIDIGLGVGGWYPGGYYDPYYPSYNHISCNKGRKILDFNKGYHNVNPVDCSLPGYKYTAWKNGHKWLVKMNGHGHITGKSMIF